MTSITEICNRALAEAGTRSTIADISEDSNEALQCRLFFESTRDEVMGMAWWNFSRFTATLSLLKALPGTPENPTGTSSNVWLPEFPAPPWLYSYAYPSDCIRARYVVPQIAVNVFAVPLTSAQFMVPPSIYGALPVRFIVSSDLDTNNNVIKVILTDQTQAIMCYNKRITDPTIWDDGFVAALVFALAAKLAFPLSGRLDLTGGLYKQANDFVVAARAEDGNEGLTIVNTVPDWIAARGDGALASYNIGGFYNSYSPLYSVGNG